MVRRNPEIINTVATLVISIPNGKALYYTIAYDETSMAGYYDVVLGLIPLTLIGVSGALMATGMSLSVAVPLAGLVVIGLIGHAMFVRTPGRERTPASAPEPPEIKSAD
jgi:hypothetical protein